MMTAAVTAPFWSLSSCSLLPCQGRMQWKRNEKKRFSRKVAFITAGFELKPPPYPLVQLERSRVKKTQLLRFEIWRVLTQWLVGCSGTAYEPGNFGLSLGQASQNLCREPEQANRRHGS